MNESLRSTIRPVWDVLCMAQSLQAVEAAALVHRLLVSLEQLATLKHKRLWLAANPVTTSSTD